MSDLTAAMELPTLGMHSFERYASLIGQETTEQILKKSEVLRGSHIVHISSTFYGGGVTEKF